MLTNRPAVAAVWDQRKAERGVRVGFTADSVLIELVEQLQRLLAMLDVDTADILLPGGAVKPVSEWPEIWRKAMLEGFDIEELSVRSQDGETKDKQGGWDQVGTVKKIKFAGRLKIEREIRETLAEIGRHVNVKAFPVPGDKLADAVGDLASVIEGKLNRARAIAAQLPERTV